MFIARDVTTGREYAIKREQSNMSHPQLRTESELYDVLAGGRKYNILFLHF